MVSTSTSHTHRFGFMSPYSTCMWPPTLQVFKPVPSQEEATCPACASVPSLPSCYWKSSLPLRWSPHSCVIISFINLALPTPTVLDHCYLGKVFASLLMEDGFLFVPTPTASISSLFILLSHCKLASLHRSSQEASVSSVHYPEILDMFYFIDHQLFLEMSLFWFPYIYNTVSFYIFGLA